MVSIYLRELLTLMRTMSAASTATSVPVPLPRPPSPAPLTLMRTMSAASMATSVPVPPPPSPLSRPSHPDEDDVGRLNCDVGARPDGDADVGLSEGGRVVDAVADHRHRVALLLQLLHLRHFVRRQHLRKHHRDANLRQQHEGIPSKNRLISSKNVENRRRPSKTVKNRQKPLKTIDNRR